nr:immunoglobulin heavy chain junction region [Macaca mulatta]MOX38446.1 immunoglobulin heavy chain junction region [Macaca mulatta]MOX38685.1 immunoglobulin heavy chain junction region [Macaca mulatta]MOX38835.1 immunoglobulin heavy chain junction region [Macaca mulatta]MOX39449.1 immunoglobulin heavy chain junction region [Macaca mulatta]
CATLTTGFNRWTTFDIW